MGLYYERTGDEGQPILLLLHGIGTSSWMWWQQINHFEAYQVIAVDLPGHGGSVSIPWHSLEDTCRLIVEDVLKEKPAHLVGVSLGGHVALELARLYPEHTLSAFISGITVKPMPYKFLMGLQSRLYQRMIHNDAQIKQMAEENYELPPEKFPLFKQHLQLLTRETYEKIGYEIMDFTLDAAYAAIEAPCLIVAGSEESQNILKSIQVAPQIIPTASGKVMEGAEHAWSVQQPERFNQVLQQWVDSIT